MENENIEEKRDNKFIIVLAILIVIICAFGWLITSNINKKEKGGNPSNGSNDYVYDADYSYENKHTKRSTGEEKVGNLNEYGIPITYTILGTHYLKDLKVPYINLNSNDAKTVNENLKKLYLQYAENFDKIVEESTENDEFIRNQILSYVPYFYEDKNILSVLVVYGETNGAPFEFGYITYNFDTKTGKLLTYAETLSKLGYDQEATITKAKNLLKEKMESLYPNINLATACSLQSKNCYEVANADFDKAIKDDSVLFFIDNEGTLNLLLIPYNDSSQNGITNRYVVKVNK